MEDWSAEMAILELHKERGKLFLIEREPPAAGDPASPTLLHTLTLERGAQRPAVLDKVHVLTFPAPWESYSQDFFDALMPLCAQGKKYFGDFHEKYHANDPRGREVCFC